jgi:cell wall-associated NlpC family hydrolase
MKRRNSGRNARFADMAVCREAEKTDNEEIKNTAVTSDEPINQKKTGLFRNKLFRSLPSITVIMVVTTLVLHMTIGGGAALVPADDTITCYDDGFSADGLASAEALAVGDFAFNRSLQPINESESNETVTAQTQTPAETTSENNVTETDPVTVETDGPDVSAAETEPVNPEPVFEPADETMFLQAGSVNLRSGPSTDTEVLTVLAYGQSMQRTGISEEWSRVLLEDGTEGFLMSKFIDSSAPPTPTPTPTPTPAPTAAPTKAPPAPPAVEKASSMSAETQQQMITFARSFLGYPYVYATSGPSSFDCSGFTSYIYREMFGISLPRSARDQAFAGTGVSASNIQVGDIICFDWKRDGVCDHVGLYIGNGQYVDASYSRGLVREGTVNFSTNPIISIRRIVN